MKKILVLVLLLWFIKLSSFADCFTGAACSIAELENNQSLQNNEFTQNIHKYFDKKINDNLFFSKNTALLSYNDLFIFNTIV